MASPTKSAQRICPGCGKPRAEVNFLGEICKFCDIFDRAARLPLDPKYKASSSSYNPLPSVREALEVVKTQ